MPKLRKRVQRPADGVPFELLDREHEVWQSLAATKAWAASHGLTTPIEATRASAGPANRHYWAADEWAKQQGYVHPDYPAFVRIPPELGIRRSQHAIADELIHRLHNELGGK